MVINGSWEGRAVTLSLKPNCLTLSFGGPGGAEVFSYDGAGRLWTALLVGVSYRRGLDGKMVAKWGEARSEGLGSITPSRFRRWLPPVEARQVEAQALARLGSFSGALGSPAVRLEAPLPPEAHAWLNLALAFDSSRSQADAARYHQVYRPVGILPPDQYMAVVLQVTEGCAFNTCTFCTFYKDRPFRIKTPAELRGHAEAVKDFLGGGLSLRRTLFLGDANALVAPMPRLLPLVETIHQIFDVAALGGLYAFLDGFSAEKKGPADWAVLAEWGLERVYVGLESGNDSLLRFLQKPGRAADAVKAVQAMKAGGVAVGVIVLLGAGGKAYARAHVKDTIAVLNAMRLDAGDLVYFSELVTSEGMEYTRRAFQANLQPLTLEERAAQGEAIERGLVFTPHGGVPHISRYDILDFVY